MPWLSTAVRFTGGIDSRRGQAPNMGGNIGLDCGLRCYRAEYISTEYAHVSSSTMRGRLEGMYWMLGSGASPPRDRRVGP